MTLFTASGERAWAPGWDPVGDDDCWQTHGHGTVTYWLTVDRSPTSARYARVTPGDTAGTVAVSCAADGESTTVNVTYDLTAIGPAGEHRLPAFEQGYADMLLAWQRLTSPLL
jgi:hypothetical protein